ncbi:MAG: T9SS type A sorting domain-containing protein [Chitinophagales bacterium]|nr:T9SS type A sorting domain-containing protein [Chitinophagales bacterium]
MKNVYRQQYLKSLKLVSILFSFVLVFYSQLAPAQWTQTKGPQGGSVTALAQIGTTIYAGTAGGQIYRTSEFGNGWTKENSGLYGYQINAILPEGMLAATYGGGIYLSTDLGINWIERNNGLGNFHANTLVQSGSILLVGTDSGMYYSSDNAATWNICQSGLTSSSRINSILLSGTKVFASTSIGEIFVSDDNGVNWSWKANLQAGMQLMLSDAGVLYAAYPSGGAPIRKSEDEGLTWSVWTYTNYFPVTVLIKSGSSFIAGSSTGVQISIDNGVSWQHYLYSSETHVNAIMISGTTLYMGDYAGASVSYDNGINWTYSNVGLVATNCYALVSSAGNLFSEDYEDQGVFRSEDDGETWSMVNDGLPLSYDPWYGLLLADGNNLFISNYYNLFAWSPSSSSWLALPNTGFNFSGIAIDSPDIYVASQDYYDHYLHHSPDYGTTWNNILVADTVNYISDVVFSKNELYALTWSSFYFSPDNGNTFFSIPRPDSGQLFYKDPLSIFLSDSALYANYFNAYTSAAFRSADHGTSWNQIGKGVFTYVYDMKFSGASIFAATDSGVFLSADEGTSWISVNEGLPETDVRHLEIQETKIYATTMGQGIWQRSLQSILSIPDIAGDNFNFSIYPNPFQQATLTHYTLKGSSIISLEVYNFLGQKVKTILQNESQVAGEHQYPFSGNSEGIYFIKMIVDGKIFSKKIIQLKYP